MSSNNSIFSKFTNLYSLTKTLRFELKPTEETKVLLQKTNNLGLTPVQTDQKIDDLYNKEMKPMYDKLHEKFITESLQNVEFDLETLSELEKNYLEFKKLSKNKKENKTQLDLLQRTDKGKLVGIIPSLQAKLRLVIAGSGKPKVLGSYDKTADIWKSQTYKDLKLKGESFDIILLESVQEILIKENPNKENQIREFKKSVGWTSLKGLTDNRKNYYTNEGKVTEVAFRCININLAKFIENKAVFESAKNKISDLSQFDEYFRLENFKNYLTQEGIEKFNDVVAEIKSKVNLEYNQKANKNEQIRGFNKLHKQIGCKTKQQKELEESGQNLYPDFLTKIGLGFKIAKNGKNYQIWEAVESLSKQLENKIKELQKGYIYFFQNWESNDYKLNEIWFRKEALNTISSRWFGGSNWSVLARSLSYNKVGSVDKEGKYTVPQFVSLLDIKEALEKLENGVEFDLLSGKINKQKDTTEFTRYTAENLFLDRYKENFKPNLFETFLTIWQYEIETKFKEIQDYKNIFDEIKTTKFDKNIKDENGLSLHTKIVKNLVEDGYLNLFRLTKYHTTDKKGEPVVGYEQDGNFYEELNNFWGDDNDPNNIVMYHKALQSSLTEKPFETDKIKLNFECGTLLGGWSSSFESHGALIFKQNGKYYLGIVDGTKFSDTEIRSVYSDINESNKAYKLDYLVQKIDNKNPPRWFIRSKGDSFAPMVRDGLINPKLILDIYDNKLFSKTDNKESYKQYLPKLLDYFKDGFRKHKDFKDFTLEWKESTEYDSVAEFYDDTASMAYKTNWSEINFEILKQTGRIYLFEITNKDLQPKKEGKKYNQNLHTTLFLELLKPENVKKLKLLGGGELFYRDPSLVKKKDETRSREIEIIENKRYTQQKYFLHFPIEIKGSKLKGSFKDFLNQKIEQNKDKITYLGLDRGEKHLVYYALVDSSGKMIDQGSFNKITVAGKEVDFHDKLTTKAGNRDKARKDWETVGNIKNFKEGYLSQVVHEIYQIVIKNNSLIVLENLNTEFKAKRTAKVEKSVYKKFELNLAKKLNHLILKDKKPNEDGGVLNAYQLTPYIGAGEISKYEDSGEWGIIKKVTAAYTSAVDPLTHWHKHIYLSNSATEKEIKELFGVDGKVQINWDGGFECYRFDYTEEIKQDKKVVETKNWSLYAHKELERFRWDPKYPNSEKNTLGAIRKYNLFKRFQELFATFEKNQSINNELFDKWDEWKYLKNSEGKSNYQSLIFYWNLLNQIRNTDTSIETDESDFIQSPVFSTELNDFFDSRKVARGEYLEYEKTNGQLPKNGDANGAYHIAKSALP